MQSIQMDINMNDIYIFKNIMEYDYEVFKVLLFLYWDLEYFLGYNVKNSLIVDSIDYIFLRIRFINELLEWKSAVQKHFEQINKQESNYF
jgi:hypothetical protein